jgi:hypothetical protein
MSDDVEALQMLEGDEPVALGFCCHTSPYTCGLTWPP